MRFHRSAVRTDLSKSGRVVPSQQHSTLSAACEDVGAHAFLAVVRFAMSIAVSMVFLCSLIFTGRRFVVRRVRPLLARYGRIATQLGICL